MTPVEIDVLVERIESLRREMKSEFASVERAVSKAEAATEKRFEGVNEFRAQLSDQAARFITRDELQALESKLVGLIERTRMDVESLAKRLS